MPTKPQKMTGALAPAGQLWDAECRSRFASSCNLNPLPPGIRAWLQSGRALYQSVASIRRRFVSGHGFSHAEMADKKMWASAPAGQPFPRPIALMTEKTREPQLAFALYQAWLQSCRSRGLRFHLIFVGDVRTGSSTLQPVTHPIKHKSLAGDPGQETGATLRWLPGAVDAE
jgi:hypothetical protein